MTDVAASSAVIKPGHTHPQPVTISFSKQAQAAAALKEKQAATAGPATATATATPAAAAAAPTDKPADAPPSAASPASPAINGTSYAQAYSAQKEKAATAAAAAAASGSTAASSAPPKHNGNGASGSNSNSSNGQSKDAGSKKLSVVPPPHMSRSRSSGGDAGFSPALSPHASNPHPMPVGTFSPQAPILLEHPWSMFLDDTNLWGVKTVEECLARMGYLGTVDSIQAFWIYFNAFAAKLLTEKKLGANSQAGSMSGPAASPVASPQGGGGGGNGRYNWRIFDSLITPVWEDELHVAGGKFILRCGGNGELRATKFIWTKLVLSMVGSNFLHQDIVCGCVLACRPHKKEIQIWIKHPPPKLKVPAESAMNVPQPAAKETTKDASATAAKQEPKEGETAATDATTAAARSTSVSPSRPAASPSPAAFASPSPDPISHCSCHVDPLVCFANDLRFLLGVSLVPVPAALGAPAQGVPGSGDRCIKIEYVPHEVTMADVAARNKRLKTKTHGRDRGSSVGGGDAKLSASAADAHKKGQPLSQKQQDQLIKDAKAERERKRAAESKTQQAAIASANLTKMKASAGAGSASSTPNPSASPPPVASPPAGSTPSLGPAALAGGHRKATASSSGLPSSSPGGGNTWADASDNDDDDLSHSRKDSLDLGIDSDAYATSSYNSASSSVAGTPLLTGRSIMTSNRAAGAGGRKESLGQGIMSRQSSDPTGTASHSADLLSSLERDTRSFEGSVNDHGFGPPAASSKVAAPLPERSPAYLELQRRQQKSGATPLRLSGGERSYHPEPDSPGFNGTPVPSPSQTPLGFITPILGASSAGSSASTTPTPRSPFTAHSPRGGRSAAGAAAARGFRPGHMVSASQGGNKGGLYSPTQPSPGYEDSEDYADEDGMQGMLQYDSHHASAARQQEDQFFQLDRTRDLLRTPLDLESLSLPPGASPKAGAQRLRDPATSMRQAGGIGSVHGGGDSGPTSPNVLSSPQPLSGGPAQAALGASGSKGSILAMVAKPASVSSLKDLSMLLAAQQAINKANNSSAEQLPAPALTAERGSAFSSVEGEGTHEGRSRAGSTASASGLSSADDDANGHSAAATTFVPKKSRPSPPPAAVPLKKRGGSKASAKKNAADDDLTALASKRPSKPRSLKVWLIYAATALVLAALIYLLFFTTLAPDEDVSHLLPAKTISEKGGSKIKVPKHAK